MHANSEQCLVPHERYIVLENFIHHGSVDAFGARELAR
jgi:hypothetical protein